MSRIVFDDDYVIVRPSFKEVLPHKHNFYHIFFLEMNGVIDHIYVVGESMIHKMPPIDKCKLFLMIDPTCLLAENLRDTILSNWKPVTIQCNVPLQSFYEMSDDELKIEVHRFLIKNQIVNEIDSDECDDRIVKLVEEIKEYKHLDISVKDIADYMNLSESRLSHAFKESKGISLKGYLNIKQMQYAYKLIMSGTSITDAALSAGFGSSAHLAYICKKQMGISISMVLK